MSAGEFAGALRLPCAHGGAVGRGTIRSQPEDFIVREWLGFEADGEGDHWLLTVRKRNANTHWITKQIAKLANIHPRDVGFAGLKDRNAVAEQSFTVPVRSAMASEWLTVCTEDFDVIAAQRHRRKLKRGALKGNDFEIVVRDFTGSAAAVAERLAVIGSAGVPSYFGPQRFGHELGNLQRAAAMFRGEQQLHDRFERGFALSAARSAVFNAVLSRRVSEGSWNRLLDGDIANLDGSNSIFAVEAVDDVLAERCARLDIHPSGPLWGRGEIRPQGVPKEIETSIAVEQAVLCAGLARTDLEQERRALRVRVQALEHTLVGDVLTLRFRLGRGAFATTVLHEVLDNAFEANTPEMDE